MEPNISANELQKSIKVKVGAYHYGKKKSVTVPSFAVSSQTLMVNYIEVFFFGYV